MIVRMQQSPIRVWPKFRAFQLEEFEQRAGIMRFVHNQLGCYNIPSLLVKN